MYISCTYISLVVHFWHGFFLFVGSTLFAGITYTAYWFNCVWPSLLLQIAAQAYVCTLIQPCFTNLYTYACLLPHVLVFIPWGIHMHGSIAPRQYFLPGGTICCLCEVFAVDVLRPLSMLGALLTPLSCCHSPMHVYCHSHCLLKLQPNSDFIALCCILTHVYAPMCAWDIYIWCVFNSG